MKIQTVAIAFALSLAPQPSYAQKWTGLHIAVGGGAEHISTDADVTTAAIGFDDPTYAGRPYPSGLISLPNKVTYVDADARGAGSLGDASGFVTVEMGYDYRLDRTVVVGSFANVDLGGSAVDSVAGRGNWQLVEAGGTVPLPGWQVIQSGTSTASGRVSTKNAVAMGARVGYLVHPKTMVYVLGGYAATKATIRFAMDVPPLALASRYSAIEDSSWRHGYALGAGLETKFDRQLSAKLEYRYSDYGSYGVSGDADFTLPVSQAYPYRLQGEVIGGVKAGSLRSNSLRLLLSLHL